MTSLYMYELYYTRKHTYLVIYFKGMWNYHQTTIEMCLTPGKTNNMAIVNNIVE